MNACNCCGAIVPDESDFDAAGGYCADCDGTRPESVDVYRVDNHAPANAYPYRAKINGAIMLTKSGAVRRFRTINEAINATRELTA